MPARKPKASGHAIAKQGAPAGPFTDEQVSELQQALQAVQQRQDAKIAALREEFCQRDLMAQQRLQKAEGERDALKAELFKLREGS